MGIVYCLCIYRKASVQNPTVLHSSILKCVHHRPVWSHVCCMRVWNALTNNYGNVMPVDWKTSYTRSLHLPALKLIEHEGQKVDNQPLDLSDDEDDELREQLDMHSIIVSCINDEPLFTAEQVIEELEEMMQESPDPDDDESPSQSDRSVLSQDLGALQRSGSNSSYEECLRQLSVSELNQTLEEVEAAIRRYSEELIQALALREELDFEKEVKNSFISLLIDVQNKQKEHRELLRKKKKIRSTTTTGPDGQRTVSMHIPGTLLTLEGLSSVVQNSLRQTFGSAGGDKQYLTTVIPYEKKAGSPSVEDLQILTKILHAMRDDSEKVPALLTDYILKGKHLHLLTHANVKQVHMISLYDPKIIRALNLKLVVNRKLFKG
ncbi:fasciculation and elongation protein zeta-2 isoform X5 [Nothobranchius furzeri]|uniref:fasciculation and elongation protein zeta-2 isoform X5 n=1 Tax=Nothobranchius furzeri TaxID=105023 RepID=UPI003904CD21